MDSSDSDSDSAWNREMFTAINKKQGKGRIISEKDRCRQIEECLDQGADLDSLDKNGRTILQIAISKGFQEVIEFILQRGVSTNIGDRLDQGASKPVDGTTELKPPSIAKNVIERNSVQALIPQPSAAGKLRSVDDERPSTSGDSYLPNDAPSTSRRFLNQDEETVGRITHYFKRKIVADNETDDKSKKPRLTLDNALQSRSHDADTVDSSSDEAMEEDSQLDTNCQGIIRAFGLTNEKNYHASGLKQSLHGDIYQLKHLMLALNRARKMGYAFCLSTEMDTAEKFDDLVLHYRDNTGDEVHRFIQVKHRQDETETISANDLLTEDAAFSVKKYFISWRKIKKHPDFTRSILKNFILCTNIGLNFDALEEADINVSEIKEDDKFFEVPNRSKQPPRYKLVVDKHSDLHDKLKTGSDVHELVRVLAKRVHDSKEIDLRTDIFKRFHVGLAKEIIDIGRKKFSRNFIIDDKLSAKAKSFREIFFTEIKQLFSKKRLSDKDIWKLLENFTLKLSSTFGKKRDSANDSDVNQMTDLPDDHIGDQEILDFFDEFILAVDQPNEVELGEMIKSEIGADSKFNLLNADLVGDSFQNDILNWFKDKSGVFLENEDVENFFKEIEIKISSVMTVGINMEYLEMLKKCDIEFERQNKDVQNFLDSSSVTRSKPILQLISCTQTLITALRVYQTLAQIETYKTNDSFVFIHLDKLLLPNITKTVLRAFKHPRNYNLLVINCESMSAKQDTCGLWNRLSGIMKNNTEKKMILIIQGDDDSAVRFKIGCRIHHENGNDISINNLTKRSRIYLLEKMVVKFQSSSANTTSSYHCQDIKTSFASLLGIHNSDDVGVEELENLSQIIDGNTLLDLIQGKDVRVGSEVKRLDEIEEYYIRRRILHHGVIKVDTGEPSASTDLIIIGGTDRTSLKKLLKNEKNIRKFNESNPAEPYLDRFVILDTGREIDQFKILRDRNPNRNIHWLQSESGILILKQSIGSTANLLEYENTNSFGIDNRISVATYLNEEELVRHDEQRIMILSDTAGMGKSTILTSLANKIKLDEPGQLVIRVDLTQKTPELADEQKKRSFDKNSISGAVDFLVDKLSGVETDLESRVFKRLIKNKCRATVFFDGFDEISPTYANTVIDLLQALTGLDLKRLFVTTRPHTNKELERVFGRFALSLQPFTEVNQKEFLLKYWRWELRKNNRNDMTEQRLENYVQGVIDLLAKSINHQMNEFTGIPLQTRLVAEVFQDFSILPTRLDIIDLYTRFVDKKFRIYIKEKKCANQANLAQMSDDTTMHELFYKAHQKLALDALFDEEIVKTLLSSQPDVQVYFDLWRRQNEGGERTGIITQVMSGRPYFIHRTFAEYFAAEFLSNTLKDDCRDDHVQKFFIAKLFAEVEHKTVRAFLNCLIPGESNTLTKKPWKFDSCGKHDEYCDIVYHVAAAERNAKILKFLLNRLNPHHENKNPPVETADAQNVESDFSKSGDRTPQVKYSLDYRSDIKVHEIFGRTPLDIAVNVADNLDTVKCIVEGGADVNFPDKYGTTPLHRIAARGGDLHVVKYLFENGADINARMDCGRTPLNFAAITAGGNLDVVKFLIDSGADINAPVEDGTTLLHEAASCSDNINVVKYLFERGLDINAETKCGHTPLYRAVAKAYGNLDTVKFLVENGAKINCFTEDGTTLLHEAASRSDNFELVEYLLQKGADINSQDKNGTTLLHASASNGNNLNLVKFLHANGADVNARMKSGHTPLHQAADACNGNLDGVKFLVEKGADVNSAVEDGTTALHYAASRWGNLDVIKYLVENGADINARMKCGRTPLHRATANAHGNLNVVMHMVENGADVNSAADDGMTPLHYAVGQWNNLDVVKYLVDKGGQIYARTKCGRTPLYRAVGHRLYDIITFLMQNGADINIQDSKGLTPLHCAVDEVCSVHEFAILNRFSNMIFPSQWDTVSFLLKKGADANIKDNDGRTPQALAISMIGDQDIIRNVFESSLDDDN